MVTDETRDRHAEALDGLAHGRGDAAARPEPEDAENPDSCPAVSGSAEDRQASSPARSREEGDSGAVGRSRKPPAARRPRDYMLQKTMIPVLLTVGVLVIVLAVAVMLYAPPAREAGSRELRGWLILLAFPLGAALMAGAWYMHRWIRRDEQA
ncbi:MAG: hypothetical protein ACOC93_01860 [Planctomycetota bacterium]